MGVHPTHCHPDQVLTRNLTLIREEQGNAVADFVEAGFARIRDFLKGP